MATIDSLIEDFNWPANQVPDYNLQTAFFCNEWLTVKTPGGLFYAVPIGDTRQHDVEEMDCWCQPLLLSIPGRGDDCITVHQSHDRREWYAVSRRRLS